MSLLIPVEHKVRVPFPYNDIPGEFCVQATRFREQATIFLLACSSHQRLDIDVSEMLAIVEKYSITLRTSAGALKSMSAKIFVDVVQRDVTNAWDTLAITANACAHHFRLDANAIQQRGHSLSLSLLAQYLLNGEIFIDTGVCDEARHKSLRHNISGLLEALQPEFDGLPVSKKALTFLKNCRFPSVSFGVGGLLTEGYIWCLPKHTNIDTRDSNLPQLLPLRRKYLEYHLWESLELRILIEKLRQRNEFQLASGLQDYLEKRITKPASPALLYHDLMACKLLRAINSGLQLHCGHLPGKSTTSIFVPQKWELVYSMHAMTTWRRPRQGKNEVGDFVSLKVSLRQGGVVNPTRWINGMAFFSNKDIREITVGWPRSWMRRTSCGQRETKLPSGKS